MCSSDLQKSNKDDYFIPQVLDIQENKIKIVAITEDNQLLKSDEFQFEGKLKDPEKFKEVTIKSVENKKLILNVATAKSKIKVLKIPKNYKWDQKIATAGDNINPLDQILGLLQAKSGNSPDFLDHLYFLITGIGQNHGKLGLLLNSRSE